jgi:hypothetical protein
MMGEYVPNHIRIVVDETSHGKVYLNGEPLRHTSEVSFTAKAGHPVEVTIKMLAGVDVETDVRIDKLKVEQDRALIEAREANETYDDMLASIREASTN